MVSENEKNSLSYAEKAFVTLNEIMSKKQKDMMENLNRAHKGELFVLQFLSMRKNAVIPSELSIALNASTARISALLGNLEKKGQIVRDIDKSNRRNILVTITEEGRKRAETEMKEIQSLMTRVFIDMGEEDTSEFIRLTSQFFELMKKYLPRD